MSTPAPNAPGQDAPAPAGPGRTAAQVVRAYWAAMNSNDFAQAAQVLSADVVIDWPQTAERICGRDDFIALNTAYPASGAWRFTELSLVAEGAQVVTITEVTDGAQRARAITLFEVDLTQGAITRQSEYWPDPYAPPKGRAQWTRPLPPDAPHFMG